MMPNMKLGRRWTTGLAILAAVAIAQTTISSPAAADKVRWKVPVAFPTTLPALGDTAPWVVERLDKASGGDVQLKLYEPGKLVPAFQIMEAVKDNKVQAGYTWIGYDRGKIPSLPLFAAVPFGSEPGNTRHGGTMPVARSSPRKFTLRTIFTPFSVALSRPKRPVGSRQRSRASMISRG